MKLKKEEAKLDTDKKIAEQDKNKHEKQESSVIDTKATVEKAQLKLSDDKNDLKQAKADEQNAAATAAATKPKEEKESSSSSSQPEIEKSATPSTKSLKDLADKAGVKIVDNN